MNETVTGPMVMFDAPGLGLWGHVEAWGLLFALDAAAEAVASRRVGPLSRLTDQETGETLTIAARGLHALAAAQAWVAEQDTVATQPRPNDGER